MLDFLLAKYTLVRRATFVRLQKKLQQLVSIHALVRRAIRLGHKPIDCLLVSIHALVRRATSSEGWSFPKIPGFNPRPRTEGDPKWENGVQITSIVSIHALVRRATRVRPRKRGLNSFQSTPSYGGRLLPMYSLSSLFMFQSTPSYGGRRYPESFSAAIRHVSIHALVRRAT